jgi:ferredoxin, 2Fe-2S
VIRITFVRQDGSKKQVVANDGDTLMSVAVRNGISEIVAECGGSCACGTCHCYVDDQRVEHVAPPSIEEQAMLECVIEPQAASRLSCQIEVCELFDGLVIQLPSSQY